MSSEIDTEEPSSLPLLPSTTPFVFSGPACSSCHRRTLRVLLRVDVSPGLRERLKPGAPFSAAVFQDSCAKCRLAVVTRIPTARTRLAGIIHRAISTGILVLDSEGSAYVLAADAQPYSRREVRAGVATNS